MQPGKERQVKPLTIRHDDFDFRMPTEFYIKTHEEFIKNDLIETLCIQWTKNDNIANVAEDLVEYINSTTNIDIQIHGWTHDNYEEESISYIARDLMAANYSVQRYFKVVPKVWYTPHNTRSENMEKAAKYVGLEISNESWDIYKFLKRIKEGTYDGNSIYFHGWKNTEMDLFPEMIEKVVIENERRRLIKNN